MAPVLMVKDTRDRVVRDVVRHRRKRRYPGIKRGGAGEGEQQRGQNHQTEPAVAKDVAVPDPGFIDYPCSPQVRQRGQQDREKKTREGVGKEEHLKGPGMMGSDDDRGDRGADAKCHVLGRKVHREGALLPRGFHGQTIEHRRDRAEHRCPRRPVDQDGRPRCQRVMSPGERNLGDDLTQQDHAKHRSGAHPVEERTANRSRQLSRSPPPPPALLRPRVARSPAPGEDR